MPARPLDLLCPSCRTPFAASGSTFSECCDGAIVREGNLCNVIGGRPHTIDAARDRDVAALLAQHYANSFAGRAGPSQEAVALTAEEAERHALAAGLSRDQLRAVQAAVLFVQVSNNLKDYFSSQRLSSPSTRFFGSNVNLSAGDRLLDVGCSAGRFMLEVAVPDATLVGLDLSVLALRVGAAAWPDKEKAGSPTWVAGDLLAMPFADGTFSHVQSSVVLAFVPIRAALAEIHRVMAAGGQLAFTIEGYGFINEEWDRTPGFGPAKLGLARWWLARVLLENGLDWQGRPGIGRLSGVTTASPRFLRRVVAAAGFVVDDVVVLQEYRGRPRLIAVTARKLV